MLTTYCPIMEVSVSSIRKHFPVSLLLPHTPTGPISINFNSISVEKFCFVNFHCLGCTILCTAHVSSYKSCTYPCMVLFVEYLLSIHIRSSEFLLTIICFSQERTFSYRFRHAAHPTSCRVPITYCSFLRKTHWYMAFFAE